MSFAIVQVLMNLKPQKLLVAVTCGHPGVISNGIITIKDFLYGGSVYYECNPGFRLIGNRRRTCLTSGNWSGEGAACKGTLILSLC